MKPITDPLLVQACDQALATNEPVYIPEHNMFAVPDVVIAEGVANGHAFPETAILNRHDGRQVYFFVPPDASSKEIGSNL